MGGEVWDEERKPLNMDKISQIRTWIRHFEESQRIQNFFEENTSVKV
ncbi:hypothetical protein [Coxiella-like endosymbiont of Rhipicephalus sanguineus]|nr:hypothetical protein [Coxiella-like endosymbiont of Rhipicephalus sanguineus]